VVVTLTLATLLPRVTLLITLLLAMLLLAMPLSLITLLRRSLTLTAKLGRCLC